MLNKNEIAILIMLGALLGLVAPANACDEIYFKVGTGYKVTEEDGFNLDGKHYQNKYHSDLSARFEVGYEKGNVTYGFTHRSQWTEGWPFNNHGEYEVNEFFVDYKFSLGM
jgi:hypothetical protein